MKKLIVVLSVILLLLVMVVAGTMGFIWYRESHIFVDDTAYPKNARSLDLREQEITLDHYERVQAQLPHCEILWNVPFQNTTYESSVTAISVKELTEEDITRLSYFPELKTVDAMNCGDYEKIEALCAAYPELDVKYQVTLGSRSVAPDTAELELENGEYDYAVMSRNLQYLRQLTAVRLRMPELAAELVEELKAAYPDIVFTCTVEVLGQEYDADTTELDLSALTPDQVPQVAEKLSRLPALATVQLMGADGTSQLTTADVKLLMAAAPNAVFHYTFDFYGYTLSTADEEVHIKNKKIGEEGLQNVRDALDIMTNCKRFLLEYCQIPNDTMAALRDEYRGRTKVVWRVTYGEGSTLTDAEVIRAVYDLVDDNCHNLIYCEDAKYMDIGHNEWLDGCDFVSGMVSLEYVIVSGAPIRSLEPFRNCKNLKMLEIAFCEYITDVSPLAECKNLQMLNISNTHVTDLSPLDDLPLTHLTVRTNPSGKCRLSQEEQDRVMQQHPDCWISFSGAQPYGVGWRYDEDELTYLDHYKVVREVFRLRLDPNIPNHVGWYLKDEERAVVEDLEKIMDEALAQRTAAPAETVPEPEEATEPAETAETTPDA